MHALLDQSVKKLESSCRKFNPVDLHLCMKEMTQHSKAQAKNSQQILGVSVVLCKTLSNKSSQEPCLYHLWKWKKFKSL